MAGSRAVRGCVLAGALMVAGCAPRPSPPASGATGASPPPPAPGARARPSVILILTDDQGWGDLVMGELDLAAGPHGISLLVARLPADAGWEAKSVVVRRVP